MKRTADQGFTLIEIMTVVAIIGLLAALALPNIIQSRTVAQRNTCINNLRQIDDAKQEWAIEMNQPPVAVPVAGDLDPYLKGGTANVACPQDAAEAFASSYDINDLNTNPDCQIAPVSHVL